MECEWSSPTVIRFRMYAGDRGFQPVTYANLVRLKRPAATLFAKMRRP
jgi:hypothetical protein